MRFVNSMNQNFTFAHSSLYVAKSTFLVFINSTFFDLGKFIYFNEAWHERF